MTQEGQGQTSTGQTGRGRIRISKRLVAAAVAVLLVVAVLVVPPLVSVSQYKSRITQLISTSLGRPVRLSSVKVRLLPTPSFLLTDLTVEEDPAYGAEPILHANTVRASIRLLSLWRGRLEIGTIDADEASMNLVRNGAGHWNLDSLFRRVAASSLRGQAGTESNRRLPDLEATDSRINIKDGVEKLPFSLLNTDLSFHMERSGEWRLQLRAQPARTDISLGQADTGIVRLNANGRRAAALRQMPIHAEMDWREAQLGQLTKLLVGVDPGWRGDLTGQMQLDGTAEAAQLKARLRAERVHRAEFAPAEPLDFDANCSLVYHYTARSVENLACDSPLGDGRIHIAGSLPGGSGNPHLSVELSRVPVQAGLDVLRTVRSGFAPGLEAQGSVSGKLEYQENPPAEKTVATVHAHKGAAQTATHPDAKDPLTGSLTVEGFQVNGGGLSSPIRLPKLVLEPAVLKDLPNTHLLSTTAAIAAGGAAPLTVGAHLGATGYQLTIRGQASIARARELAHVNGMSSASALDGLAGGSMTIDLSAQGPWMPASAETVAGNPANQPFAPRVSGTVELRDANWTAAYLANRVTLSQATLHLGDGEIRWEPVEFAFGPVKGTATLTRPEECAEGEECAPRFDVTFNKLDAAALQQAALGARKQGTLLATLIDRLQLSRQAPAPWPRAEGTVHAGTLLLGPVTLENVAAELHLNARGAKITNLDAGLLGGGLHLSGTLETGEKPTYTLECQLKKLNSAAVGEFLDLHATGAGFDADGKIVLTGFTSGDLAASAKGTMYFEWKRGAISGTSAAPALAKFDRWSGDAEIADGKATVKQNQAEEGKHKRVVEAVVPLETPVRLTFPKEATAKHD